METTTLYRPIGLKEHKLIYQSDFREFPPRLPEQPIFYPVLTEKYATKIARDWNVAKDGAGFVARFQIQSDFLSRYEIKIVGGKNHQEYWIPAKDLVDFNKAIVGQIEMIAEYYSDSD